MYYVNSKIKNHCLFKNSFTNNQIWGRLWSMELKEGMVLVFGDGEFSYETEEDFFSFTKDERLIHYVCMAMRPGIEELSTRLEHTHYKPLTPRNDLLHIRVLLWNDIHWIVISIPSEDKQLLESMAGSCGMRVVNGVPVILGNGSLEQFPINKNAFTLENLSDHPVYRNDDALNRVMQEAEHQIAEDIRTGKEKKSN